jgi:hypothetical protein
MYTSRVKTPHTMPTPPGNFASAGGIAWAGSTVITPGGTVTFGFDHPNPSWDVEWFSAHPGGVSVSQGQVGQPIAGPMGVYSNGWVHSPACNNAIPSVEVTRLGTPPNPNAFLPGVTIGPVIGSSWDPVVTPFHPGAFVDFVGVDFTGPLNVPTAMGTLLIWPPPRPRLFFNWAPGSPFSLAVPFDCSLIGVSAWSQGGSVSAGPNVALANALDIVFGTY